jgi:hypothetical protein
MDPWRFRQYVTAWDEWPFRDWYLHQSAAVRVAFDLARDALVHSDDWVRPRDQHFKELTDDHAPLGEVRFWTHDFDRSGRPLARYRWRVVGLLRPAERDFVMFGGAEERRNRTYDPPDAFDRAWRYYLDFKRGNGHVEDYE